ncbi:unnamed protein product [Closterium sp. NIES-54]
MARLMGFAAGTVATSSENYPDLRAEFHVVQLLTFTVISRCCSPGVQIAMKPCRDYVDAGHQAWHFIESTYQVTYDLYIGQLEEQMTRLRMGDQETATDYCNQARRLLATMRITRATLNEDSLTSYILRDEAMKEAEWSMELQPEVKYAAPAKQSDRPGQHGQSGGGGRSGGKLTKDAEKKKSARDIGRGGGSQHQECWLCNDPEHLSFECPDRSDSDDDDTKGGRGRSAGRHLRRESKPRKEKQSTKASTSAKDAVSSSGGKGRGDKEASCSLVGVVEPIVSLAPEAGEDFQAMAAAVQANPVVVLLDNGCSHHLMGTKEVFVDLGPSGEFNVHANLLSAGQLKESWVKLQDKGDGMLIVSAAGDVLGRATYTGRVLCTNLCPCTATSTSTTMEAVALQTIATATKSTPARWHVRLVHVGIGTITSSAKHKVAIGLDVKPLTGIDSLCVLCIGGKLARHTFPDKGSDADDALNLMHIDLPVAKFDVLREFEKWLVVVERQTKKSVLMLRSDWGGEFLGRQFTDFVDGKGTVHDLTCPYTPQYNGMAEREMRTVVESAVWVRNCLERSTLPQGTTPHQLPTSKKPDLTLARVWGCMAQFLVPEQQCGGAFTSECRRRARAGSSSTSTTKEVVITSDVVFYETMSLEVWKSEHGPASGRTQVKPPRDTSTVTLPLLAKVGELADEDTEDVRPPSLSPAHLAPPLVADLHELTSTSASGNEGSCGASPVAPAKSIAGGRRDVKQVGVGKKLTPAGEQQAEEVQPTLVKSVKEASAKKPPTGEKSAVKPTKRQSESTDNNVVKVNAEEPELRRSSRLRRLPERLTYHVCLPPAAFTTLPDDVDADVDLPELDPDMRAELEHRWDIMTMTVKEALASWKGKVVKTAMDEEIRSLIGMGTWELVDRPRGVNIMKNRWVLMTTYHVDNMVAREKARLVMKGFMQVHGADYDETYALVGSYVTLRIFLSIVAVLDLNLMQLDMKNAFLQSKLDRVLYMYQPDYYDDGTSRVCKLLKSLYELKQSPLLWYKALDDVLVGADGKKS